MKKKYLQCFITRYDGTSFNNPLKLSEVYLISQISQENKSVLVTLVECSQAEYKVIFE